MLPALLAWAGCGGKVVVDPSPSTAFGGGGSVSGMTTVGSGPGTTSVGAGGSTTIVGTGGSTTIVGAGGSTATSGTGGAAAACEPAGGVVPPTAPNGYYVNGNTICTGKGKPHLLHGVDRPSMEWSATGQNLSAADFTAMASWHANVVRVALNQDFWLSASPEYQAGYAPLVDQVVQWIEAAGMDVILDLHWSDTGNYTVKPAQQLMADAHSLQFWSEVASRYKGDGRVFFELYNEPNGISPQVWLSGGMSGPGGFMVAGMQQLYAAVRGAGAENLVIVGGLDFAYDLSFVQSSPVVGHNILYATHPYNNAPERQPANWDHYWGDLTATSPVVVTEFGDISTNCTAAWDEEVIKYADAHDASWTAWAWYPGGCSFPSLLSDWSYDTSGPGAAVKAALLGYHDPASP